VRYVEYSKAGFTMMRSVKVVGIPAANMSRLANVNVPF